MTPNASKQGKFDSFTAIFLFIFLPCLGLGFQNNSPLQVKQPSSWVPASPEQRMYPWNCKGLFGQSKGHIPVDLGRKLFYVILFFSCLANGGCVDRRDFIIVLALEYKTVAFCVCVVKPLGSRHSGCEFGEQSLFAGNQALPPPSISDPQGWKSPQGVLQSLWLKEPERKPWPQRGEDGLKMFRARFGSFFWIHFRAFQTMFRININIFRGQFPSADVPP